MQSGIKLISRIYLKLVLLQVAVGTLLRIVLLFNEQTSDISFTFGQWLKIFLLGAVNDWCALTIGFAVLWLFALSIAPGKYARPLGYILFGILSVAWIYVTFFNTIFDEYGSVVPLIASILFGFWAVSFGLRLFLPQIRPGWRRTWLAVLTGLYTGGIILNAVSEWFFWSEFGVRYNFIAVDYLVYTNEVVGNIMESYPVVPLFAGVLLLTVGCTWLLFRREIRRAGEFGTWQWKAAVSPAYLLLTLGCCLLLQFNTRFQQSANTYANELQATGAYKFYDAFMKNELSYPQFYLTLPQKEAEANVHAIYGSVGDNLRHIPGNPDTLCRNIVLITIESMSASFMQHFGYPDAITPHLDSLYKWESLSNSVSPQATARCGDSKPLPSRCRPAPDRASSNVPATTTCTPRQPYSGKRVTTPTTSTAETATSTTWKPSSAATATGSSTRRTTNPKRSPSPTSGAFATKMPTTK